MHLVLIDTFVVPEQSRSAFLDAARRSASILKTFPGYVEGYIYEKIDGESTNNIVTTAVWENTEAFENARKNAKAKFEQIGFRPPEIMDRLQVTIQRAVYMRSPY